MSRNPFLRVGEDVVGKYAHWLGLKRGSGDWHAFFDLAAVSKGRIPAELMEDEDLVAKLPLIFRALRGKRFTGKQLDDLVGKVHAQEVRFGRQNKTRQGSLK